MAAEVQNHRAGSGREMRHVIRIAPARVRGRVLPRARRSPTPRSLMSVGVTLTVGCVVCARRVTAVHRKAEGAR